MLISLALPNNTDYKTIQKNTEEFFGLTFKKVSKNHFTTMDYNREFIITIINSILQFIIFDESSNKAQIATTLIKDYLARYYSDQVVGLYCRTANSSPHDTIQGNNIVHI